MMKTDTFWEVHVLEKQDHLLWKIFISTLYLSTFTFGGGYVIVTLMKKKFVDDYHWIDEQEMLDLIAIAQSSPGAIAINGAIVIGYKLAGPLGILAAILGTILPPFIIISILSFFYAAFKSNEVVAALLEGMQAGVGAVIASVAYDMGLNIVKEKKADFILMMIIAFIANYFYNFSVIYIVLIAGLIGLFKSFFYKRGDNS